MTKVHAKIKARMLRESGHSYNHISQAVNVSKSTLTLWLADIPYTPNSETIARIGSARAAAGKVKSKIKFESIALAKKEAERSLQSMTQRDLFMLGLGLYIGEGSKSGLMTRFANSDPAAINLMIHWFTKALGVPKKNLRLRIHLYPDCNEKLSLQYWSRMTGVPRTQFYRTSIDRRTNKRVDRAGKLPHGTAHLIVVSLGDKRWGVFLARKITAWSAKVLGVSNQAGVV